MLMQQRTSHECWDMNNRIAGPGPHVVSVSLLFLYCVFVILSCSLGTGVSRVKSRTEASRDSLGHDSNMRELGPHRRMAPMNLTVMACFLSNGYDMSHVYFTYMVWFSKINRYPGSVGFRMDLERVRHHGAVCRGAICLVKTLLGTSLSWSQEHFSQALGARLCGSSHNEAAAKAT